MPDPAARESTNPSAGGARAASGFAFQAEVFAWWAAHAVSGTAPGLGLDPAVRIDAVGCETGFPVDDVGIALTALRRLLAGDEPVVVIGTIWLEFWKELTSAPEDGAGREPPDEGAAAARR